MGIARGTNIVRDGLIYGYDTGYGVADNNTATRFFPGKKTINFLSSGLNSYNVVQAANWSGATPTFTLGTSEFGTPIGTYTTAGTSYMYSHDYVLDDDLSTLSAKAVTFSIYLKRSGGSNIGTVGIRVYDNISGYTTVYAAATSEFQRFTLTKTLGANPTRIFVMIDNTNGGVIDFHSPQLEIGDASPFVDGSRSGLQSLIDLKRTTNIDTDYISFSSNGQPDFDGTDDYITQASNLQNGDSAGSWEFVVNFDECHDDDTSSYLQIYVQELSVWIAQYYDKIGIDITKDNGVWFDTNGGVATGSQIGPVVKDTWYHGIFTFDQGVIKGYLNGVLGFTTTVSGMSSIKNGQTPRNIGRRSSNYFDGELPVFKIYDKALSQTHVTQNYKAYKNRFNI